MMIPLPHRQRTAFLCGYALLLAFAGSALAATGQPVVHVDTDEKLNAAHITASIDIAASPAVVWNILTDCARMTRIMPTVESCRVLKRDTAGKWEVREHVINWSTFMPKIRTIVRNTYEAGRRLMFRRVGGDMRISQGEWKLEPRAHGTRLSYNALIAPDFPVPQFMVQQAIHSDMPALLRSIQKASLEDAGKK